MTKKIIILVIAWFILFGRGYTPPDVRPEVNVGDFISDFEAMSYAGLFHMMGTVSADEVKPDIVKAFIENHKSILNPLSIREGLKHLKS